MSIRDKDDMAGPYESPAVTLFSDVDLDVDVDAESSDDTK
jgi:hypothetical protein